MNEISSLQDKSWKTEGRERWQRRVEARIEDYVVHHLSVLSSSLALVFIVLFLYLTASFVSSPPSVSPSTSSSSAKSLPHPLAAFSTSLCSRESLPCESPSCSPDSCTSSPCVSSPVSSPRAPSSYRTSCLSPSCASSTFEGVSGGVSVEKVSVGDGEIEETGRVEEIDEGTRIGEETVAEAGECNDAEIQGEAQRSLNAQSFKPIALLNTTNHSSAGSAAINGAGVIRHGKLIIVPKAIPHTYNPHYLRDHITTYTIRDGDTIYSIATRFSLRPESIVWSNWETVGKAPWMISPGMTLYIPPLDGVLHISNGRDTLKEIAGHYNVDVVVLYNAYNEVVRSPSHIPPEGAMLFVPGGVGPEIDWTPPNSQYAYVVNRHYVVHPVEGEQFILPTGSRAVSGWYFHDPRNPMHIGLDYLCYLDNPIYASRSGVVIFAGWGGGYGNLVKIDHGDGYVTYYAHLDLINVTPGQTVLQGSIIGLCGTTGWSTGPHLHYEIRYNGVPQDPQAYEPNP